MTKNIKLNMSRRIRRTPYTNRVEEHGVSDFTVVNHMLLPKGFKNTVEEDYWHLSKEVQIWDVSCQRQVQISGPDAVSLIQKLTPRSIKNMEIGNGEIIEPASWACATKRCPSEIAFLIGETWGNGKPRGRGNHR